VIIEDLTVRNMLRNHTLARAISDASWSQLRRQLEYKADWYGRSVIAIDRWYPSSRTCSACGVDRGETAAGHPGMGVPVRTVHDRDINAAKVVLAAGLAVAACGDGVRPART
jgi:putative transposase